jgi:uncharacterized phiE125 gp8 family phage protein
MKNNRYEITKTYEQNFINIIDIKNYLKITIDEDDNLIEQFINSAIESCENYCSLSLFAKNINYIIDGFRSDRIYLPVLPLREILSIKTSLDKEEMIDCDALNKNSREGIIYFTKNFYFKKLEIIYVAGFQDKTNIPRSFIQGIMMHVGQMYDSGTYKTISEDLQKLYQPYRKVKI